MITVRRLPSTSLSVLIVLLLPCACLRTVQLLCDYLSMSFLSALAVRRCLTRFLLAVVIERNPNPTYHDLMLHIKYVLRLTSFLSSNR